MAFENPRTKKATANVENILGFGCFQVILFICLHWCLAAVTCNWFFMAFGKLEPKNWACLDDIDLNMSEYSNFTMDNDHLKCGVFKINGKCENFTWDGAVFYSIVPHWQLVCDRVKNIYLMLTLQMFGGLISAPVFGQLSDSYGRKWAMMGALATTFASGIASAFSPNWQVFAFWRFVIGFGGSGFIVTNYVYFAEFLTKRDRLWFFNIANWAASYLFVAGMAYATADWRKLSIIPNIFGIPTIIAVWLLGETPMWLIQKGRIHQAEKQLRLINRINRTVLNEEELKMVLQRGVENGAQISLVTKPENEPKKRQYSYWHLFGTKKLAIYTIVLSLVFFITNLVSNGMTFSMDKLAGNVYINFAIMGGMRWIMNIATSVADLMIKKFGRRFGTIVPLFLISVCSAIVVFAHIISDAPALQIMTSVISMIVAMLSQPLWSMVYLSNAELFPTPIRNIAVAFCSTMNRLASVIMPEILYLAHLWKPAPFVVFSILSLMVGSLVAIFIPETKGKPLPDRMPERMNSYASLMSPMGNFRFDMPSRKTRRRKNDISEHKDEVNDVFV